MSGSLIRKCSAITKKNTNCSFSGKFLVSNSRYVCGIHHKQYINNPRSQYYFVDPPPPPPTETCSICLSDIHEKNDITTLKVCGHTFHTSCIVECINHGHKKCPLCRSNFNIFQQPSLKNIFTKSGILFSFPLFGYSVTARYTYPIRY
jgi:hypothetical protein